MQYHRRPFNLREFKIEVTYRCDLNCVHCSSDARPSNSLEMSRDDCVRILAQAAHMGARDVAFSGGEPLLWPYIFAAVDAAARHGLKVTVYTSGCADGFQEKAKRLRELGTSRFIFSMFGATATSHERVTRKAGSFEHTQSAMRYALSVGLTTELHFVPMAGNYSELADVAQLARELGASRVSVLRLVPQGRAALVRDRTLSRVQNLELRRAIQALRAKHGHDFVRTGSPYNFLMLNDSPACFSAVDRLIIGPDLRLYPCEPSSGLGLWSLWRRKSGLASPARAYQTVGASLHTWRLSVPISRLTSKTRVHPASSWRSAYRAVWLRKPSPMERLRRNLTPTVLARTSKGIRHDLFIPGFQQDGPLQRPRGIGAALRPVPTVVWLQESVVDCKWKHRVEGSLCRGSSRTSGGRADGHPSIRRPHWR